MRLARMSGAHVLEAVLADAQDNALAAAASDQREGDGERVRPEQPYDVEFCDCRAKRAAWRHE